MKGPVPANAPGKGLRPPVDDGGRLGWCRLVKVGTFEAVPDGQSERMRKLLVNLRMLFRVKSRFQRDEPEASALTGSRPRWYTPP